MFVLYCSCVYGCVIVLYFFLFVDLMFIVVVYFVWLRSFKVCLFCFWVSVDCFGVR